MITITFLMIPTKTRHTKIRMANIGTVLNISKEDIEFLGNLANTLIIIPTT
ncbi:hypothetical protein LV92_03510 [Arenibacter echinorum]|uniref:Uncharacterized protein n=1 Tax=Arenibacter echinorum TaxID=440515 RepID=A0A327QVN5_9FLAO|nr:hypothetical protein LV92_03510 [Arenibacter echinorum]